VNTFIDVLMLICFVIFMIFIFGGYHKIKFEKRKEEKEEKG